MQRERRKNNDILFHFRKDDLPMTKLSQLKIDPEFQNQINPPSFEETHQLEMNILKEERILNPIITWNGYTRKWSCLLKKYYDTETDNASFVRCIDVMAKLIQKYGSTVLEQKESLLCATNSKAA